jgi:hypothetical protein
MPFSLESFVKLRPFLYHLTSADNLDLTRSMRRLKPAAEFIKASGSDDLLRRRREGSCFLLPGSVGARLQSQSPLRVGNITFSSAWTLGDLIECLNGLVFFWPGTQAGPSRYGTNHFASSSWDEKPVALRVDTAKLFESNPGNDPLFCRFNSGSPRCVNGRKSPRGPNTFMPAEAFLGARSEVVEVAFRRSVHLPDATALKRSHSDLWEPFFNGV